MSPSILSCCFEIEDDVRSLFINEFKDIVISNFIDRMVLDTIYFLKEEEHE